MVKSDRELLDRIAKKEETAFDELYNRYSKSILMQISSRISNVDAIEDLCQEFWLFVWSSNHLIRTDENGNASKSLYFTVSKRILDYYRNSAKAIVTSKENIENNTVTDIL